MLFRLWYHVCQFATLAILAGMLGMAFNITALVSAVSYVLIPCGLIAALLGLLHVTIGIRTPCPVCGQKSSWIAARKFLGINCQRCGIFGGYPLMHIVPFKIEEVDEDTDPANDAFEKLKN